MMSLGACVVLWMSLVAAPSAAAPTQTTPVEIRVLSDRTESHLAPFFALYEKQTGVKVTAVYLDKGLISRLESRPTEADVVITKDADLLEIAKQKGLLQPVKSARIKERVPAEFRDAQDMYLTDSYRVRAIFYARDRVKPTEVSRMEDLADKKWKGRVCIRSGYHDYNLSLFGQMAAVHGVDKTRRFLEALSANLARTPTGNDRDQVRGIYEKKCDVAVVNSYYMGIMLSSQDQRPWGQSAGVIFPNQADGGSYILRSGLALTRAKDHVPQATSLLEFLVQEDVQDMLANHTFAYPVASKRPLPEINRKLGEGQPGIKDGVFRVRHVSLADTAAQRDAIIRMLDEIQFDKPR